MQELIVHDTFYTAQGEGYWMGKPAVFVRLQGCNLRCPWCDEPNALEFNTQKQYAERAMLGPMTPDALFARIKGEAELCKYVVMTGGEPTAQDFSPLVARLMSIPDMMVSVETNGTIPAPWLLGLALRTPGFWITLSPKPRERQPHAEVMEMADEVKLIIEEAKDIEVGLGQYSRYFYHLDEPRIFLQAEDSKQKEMLPFMLEAVQKYPTVCRLSPRLHKLWGLK